jgi:NDP-sugar pyrophosphorylase family protein
MRIEISREEELLDTGGGLKKAAWFFQESPAHSEAEAPFILHNVDVLSNIDLGRMRQAHIQNRALATLAVQDRETSRYLLFDERQQLCGRRAGRIQPATMTGLEKEPEALAFSGLHIVSPRLLSKMAEGGAFSIIDTYLRLAAEGEKIQGFRADQYYWRDLGKPEAVKQAALDLKQGIIRE